MFWTLQFVSTQDIRIYIKHISTYKCYLYEAAKEALSKPVPVHGSYEFPVYIFNPPRYHIILAIIAS